MRRSSLFAALLLLAACAGGSADEDNPFSESYSPVPGRIQIQVENVNFQDATLTAYSRTGRERLGVVDGKGRRQFTMEWESTRDLEIHIDLLSSVEYVTPPLTVSPGDVLRLRIETVLSASQLIR